ncbi:hypothetical protein Fmac_028248 [Flemingia macrophylla]|uniref:Membrane protein of ER body-like protein n=1 Tax=Flemingia macrophylla TaxID=520843 RepID=A0ABD1L6Y7_9FABA
MDHFEDPDKKFKGAQQHRVPEPVQSEKQMNQSEDNHRYMDHPKNLDQKFKGEPQYKAPESDRLKSQYESDVGYVGHPEGLDKEFKGEPRREAPKHDPSKKQKNLSKGNVDYIDHPEGHEIKIKDAPQHEAPKPEQPKKQMNQSEGNVDNMDRPEGTDKKYKGELQPEAPKHDQSKKQLNQLEGVVGHMDHPNGPDQRLKGPSQHKALEPDRSKKQMNQSKAKDNPKSAIKVADDKGKQSLKTTEKVVAPGPAPQKVASEGEDKINGRGLENITGFKSSEASSSHLREASQDQGDIAPKKTHFWTNWAIIGDVFKDFIPKKPKISSSKKSGKQPEIGLPDGKQEDHVEVKIDEADKAEVVTTESTPLVTTTVSATASSKTLEILKSIVYGGFLESLASLSVVTSAASAGATTLNIVALAIANLIGGLFVLGHNLEELKSEQVDRYKEILGQTENFILHALIAILSFIVFGLVPPVVYGFSFRESDDKDLKVAAVAGASLLCIILLSIAKAYIKKPNSFMTYFKTVLYYVSTGAVASVLAYLVGDFMKKLIEKLGWFESTGSFAFQFSETLQQPTWGTY